MSGKDGSAELKGNATGVGYNLGIHLGLLNGYSLVSTTVRDVKMKVKRGFATFTTPTSLSSQFPYTAFTSSIKLPRVISVGWALKPTTKLSIQADANFVGWSSYDSLKFDYEMNTASLMDTRTPRRYKNTVALRLGGSYMITDKWTVMLGAAYDPSPVRDGFVSPDLPDADHIMATGGLTFKPFKRLTILGVFEYVFTQKRSGTSDADNFAGEYQTKIVNPGLGLTYDF